MTGDYEDGVGQEDLLSNMDYHLWLRLGILHRLRVLSLAVRRLHSDDRKIHKQI
jgi:hypothetical protein